MTTPTPNATRKRILQLDMHELTAQEIADVTGVKRVTVAAILARTRGVRESMHRGKVTLLHDPRNIFEPGARFNLPDVRSWMKVGKLADGTTFEFLRRDGSTDRKTVSGGVLVAM
jgi:hypothetical protein